MGNTQNRPADPPVYSASLSPSPAPSPAPPPLKSAPSVAPSLISTPPPPPPPPPSGSPAPPRRLAAPPQISPSYAPVPLILPKMVNHHYAAIAAAAAAVFLALLVLGVLVLKRKKLPECIRADRNGHPQQGSVEVKSEVVAGASENAKKDLGSNGNPNHEDYVITLNVYSSPGHGRRRTHLPATLSADLSSDHTDGLQKQGAAESGSEGAKELRTDDLSKSGRSLGERNRDARSVRTRNFAAARTD
ncbi:hypothetical protein SUGI_0038070 [Cryptomeria japonica]|nr:hypothetical protein SUGI_0038070 [Cryptomeria japonica]